jgi:MFS family permease
MGQPTNIAQHNQGAGPDSLSGRAAIFLLSLGVLILEIALTRIFSFSLWYHFTYVAISVALLGYGASGAFLAASDRLAGRPPTRLMPQSMLLASLGVLVSLMAIVVIPLHPFSIGTSPLQLFFMVLLFVVTSSPFYAAGLAMASAFRATTSPTGVYFADLTGAGTGCALAIGAIWVLGSPGAAVAGAALFVIASVLAAERHRRMRYALIGLGAVGACVLFVSVVPFRPSEEKLLAKMMEAGVKPSYSRWSPIFRVDVYPAPLGGFAASRRGVSPHFTGPVPRTRFIAHDGTAEAPMHEFRGDMKELDFLRHNVSAIPYLIAKAPKVLVIGLGGGFDVLNGLRNGASRITGVELDPLTVDVVRNREGDFNGHILSRPDVETVVAEGRSFLRHSSTHYDIIQLTGVDTLAALSTGAYMLAESYLYTVEAMQEYLQHLTPDGTVSLMIADYDWHSQRARFSIRHVMNFIGAAEQMGITDPAQHVAIIGTPGGLSSIELLFKPRPFTAEETRTLQAFAQENGFDVWHLPRAPQASTFTQLLDGDATTRNRILAAYPLNVRETRDDRPFFFHFYRWGQLLSSAHWEVDVGHTLATGQLVLGAILIVSTVAAVGLIIVPLLLTRRLRRPGTARFGVYFAAIGLGFMFIEVSLIQHFILFLGHPTYSVAIILLALLVSAGFGSYCSGLIKSPPRAIIGASFIALLVLLACYTRLVPVLFERWLGEPAMFRYAVTVVMLMPLGLTLGVFFPSGLREIRARDELLVPWAWGANGAASVVGSILSIVLAISVGFGIVLLIASGVYLVGIAALMSSRGEQQSMPVAALAAQGEYGNAAAGS